MEEVTTGQGMFGDMWAGNRKGEENKFRGEKNHMARGREEQIEEGWEAERPRESPHSTSQCLGKPRLNPFCLTLECKL